MNFNGKVCFQAVAMILILEPNTSPESSDYRTLAGQLDRLPGIQYRVHREVGAEVTLTEIYLIGNTAALTVEQMQVLPCVRAGGARVGGIPRARPAPQGDDRPASSSTTACASARTR